MTYRNQNLCIFSEKKNPPKLRQTDQIETKPAKLELNPVLNIQITIEVKSMPMSILGKHILIYFHPK